MSKGKAKPQVTNSIQQTTMPDYVVSAQKNLLGTGQDILKPYLEAGTSGYGVAGFNADQNAAMQGVRDLAGNDGLNPAEITKFLNPYTQNVVDTTNQTLRDQNDRDLNAIRARTAAGSSFGGSNSRGFLMEAEANRNLEKNIASSTAQLMAQGYDKATATAIASQGLQQQQIQGLMSIGDKQQELDQTKLDVPLKGLQQLAAITPQQYGSTTTGQSVTTGGQQQPSGLQQALGGLLSLGGMKTAGGGSLAGSFFSSLPALFASDETLKTDIQKLGKDEETGLPMYAYRYRGDPKTAPKVVGPMAQDVQRMFPEAVTKVGNKLAVHGPLLDYLASKKKVA